MIYPHILHNGVFIDKGAATLPITTPAMFGALGVYETILARGGVFIALREHLQRLFTSAAGAEMAIVADLDTLIDWCGRVLAANDPDGLVRVLALDLDNAAADLFIYQASYALPAPADYETGVPVAIYHGERALPQVKSFNTLVPGLARKAAVAAGAHDALLIDRGGNITEGSNCNVFAVMAGGLLVPPSGAVLEGTVMAQTIVLAQTLGIPVVRCPLPLAQVPAWEEAFLTSTRRGVLPINRVGQHNLGAPGPVTRRLGAAYRAWESSVISKE